MTVSRFNLALGDTPLGTTFSILNGGTFSVVVAANPVLVQFSEVQPPQPAIWSADPILVDIGSWSHSEEFGWFRLQNATPGQVAIVTFSAYSG